MNLNTLLAQYEFLVEGRTPLPVGTERPRKGKNGNIRTVVKGADGKWHPHTADSKPSKIARSVYKDAKAYTGAKPAREKSQAASSAAYDATAKAVKNGSAADHKYAKAAHLEAGDLATYIGNDWADEHYDMARKHDIDADPAKAKKRRAGSGSLHKSLIASKEAHDATAKAVRSGSAADHAYAKAAHLEAGGLAAERGDSEVAADHWAISKKHSAAFWASRDKDKADPDSGSPE